MNLSSGLQDFETTFARLAFDLATSADPGQSMAAVLAAQRAALLAPIQPLIAVLASVEEDGAELEVNLPHGLEISRRIAPIVSEFLVEGVRNWKAHGRQSRAERKFASKSEKCRLLLDVQMSAGGIKVAIHDDGPGLNPASIIERLKRSGRVSPSDLSSLESAASRGDIGAFIAWIFKDGTTTREALGADAGNGIGLSRIHRMADELGGRASAGVSPPLGGFVLSVELPCSLMGVSVAAAGDGWVRSLAAESLLSGDSGDFRIFYRIPTESRAWASQNFRGAPVSWISLGLPTPGGSGFRAIGLRSDSPDV